MVNHAVTIGRRIPTYDFVIQTNLSARAASEQLDRFLQHQPRPRGFVILDHRVDGTVSGMEFELHPRSAGFGGSVRPFVEDYIVPTESGGSEVVARVRNSHWWFLFGGFMLVVGVAQMASSFSLQNVLSVGWVLVVISLLQFGTPWLEGPHAVSVVTTALSDGAR